MKPEHALTAVIAEYKRATTIHGPMRSAHEAYAILLEEVDELWDEIKKRPSARDVEAMRSEAIQIGAMALRFLVDVCGEPAPTGEEGWR